MAEAGVELVGEHTSVWYCCFWMQTAGHKARGERNAVDNGGGGVKFPENSPQDGARMWG